MGRFLSEDPIGFGEGYLGLYLALSLNVGLWYSMHNPLPRYIITDYYYVFFFPLLIFQILVFYANKNFLEGTFATHEWK